MFYGPGGRGHLTGAPVEQQYYSTAENFKEATKLWVAAEDLTGVSLTLR
jgi:hypothetical protein